MNLFLAHYFAESLIEAKQLKKYRFQNFIEKHFDAGRVMVILC